MRIAFAASECVPYAKTGGLADVMGALPRALAALGHEVSVFLPKYRQTRLTHGRIAVRSATIPFDDRFRFCQILDGGLHEGVRHYFVDYPPFFEREGLYGTPGGEYPDNAERYAMYARAVLEACKQTGVPDVFHCNDWQSALIPVLLKTQYVEDPVYRDVPVVFTIHNMGYQGQFRPEVLPLLMLPWDLFTLDRMEFFGLVNFLKGAIVFSDAITTVSRKYSQEIQTAENGFGLEGVLRERASRVYGILNGVDYHEWSPEADKYILRQFSASDLKGKAVCKQALLKEYGIAEGDSTLPVMGIVSRFAAQKGFDLIAEVADRLVREDVITLVLGTGEQPYEELFRRLAQQFPQKFGVRIGFDNELAHRIEAGADMFLMPSRYEPCGLNQIYSLRYGTVPIVRATGGLDDTIEHYDPKGANGAGAGTGFKFWEYSGHAMLETIRFALRTYQEPEQWRGIVQRGMMKDFSWDMSAKEYVKIYEKVRIKKQ